MIKKVHLLGIVFFLFIQNTYSQHDYYDAKYSIQTNRSFIPNIESVQLHRLGNELSMPIITHNTNEQLILSFDRLSTDLLDFSYTFIHCDVNWRPSDLNYFDYAFGLPEDYIRDYKFSRNTIQRYIHYNIVFPNEQIKLNFSGNYIIKVFKNDNPDDIVLTWRFFVAENLVDISTDIKRTNNVQYRNSRHELDFSIIHPKYNITNPYQNLKVVLMKNHRWDNMITDLKPVFPKMNEIVYDYDEENTFEANNEYRFFSTRVIGQTGENIDNVYMHGDTNVVLLSRDVRRANTVYLNRPDINGYRQIKSDNFMYNSDVDADYAMVLFEIESDFLHNKQVYVHGGLCYFDLNEKCRMEYNYQAKAYRAAIYLKQGFYNYQYAVYSPKTKEVDKSYFEGSFFETGNTYSFFVYYTGPGAFYDRLIGYKQEDFPKGRR